MSNSESARLSKDFFNRKTVLVAKELLGKKLVHVLKDGSILSGIIVETEAYLEDEASCHASRGCTPRTAPMFEDGGISYVYFIYGMYNCVNVVTEPQGRGCAVLIRALEPIDGIEVMQKNRKKTKLTELCSGPGKLTQALAITKDDNQIDLVGSDQLYIEDVGIKVAPKDIHTTTRIGISVATELPYRFYIKENKFVSKK